MRTISRNGYLLKVGVAEPTTQPHRLKAEFLGIGSRKELLEGG